MVQVTKDERFERLIEDAAKCYESGKAVPHQSVFIDRCGTGPALACALGAAFLAHHDATHIGGYSSRLISHAMTEYGMDGNEFNAFLCGFDNPDAGMFTALVEESPNAFAYGQYAANRFIKKAA